MRTVSAPFAAYSKGTDVEAGLKFRGEISRGAICGGTGMSSVAAGQDGLNSSSVFPFIILFYPLVEEF